MRWAVAAPFFKDASTARWIDDFARTDRHEFIKVPTQVGDQRSWHARKQRGTPLGQWGDYYRQASEAVRIGDGVITVFPQLAACAGVAKMLRRRKTPIVAWCFNVGAFPSGAKRAAAKWALSGVDRIVVHSRSEVDSITELLGLKPGIVHYVPLQRAPIERTVEQEQDHPFALAMGSANRDYATLFQAAQGLDFPTVVVAAPRCVEGLTVPANVTVRSNLSPEECRSLAQRARFSIVPLADTSEASGQVTVIEAMRMNSAVIATRSVGTEDYIENDVTGVLVAPGDADELRQQMRRLWSEAGYRESLAQSAGAFAESHLSDEAASASLVKILDSLTV